jgi:hypothetical protein
MNFTNQREGRPKWHSGLFYNFLGALSTLSYHVTAASKRLYVQ